jgi:hypothetical protein
LKYFGPKSGIFEQKIVSQLGQPQAQPRLAPRLVNRLTPSATTSAKADPSARPKTEKVENRFRHIFRFQTLNLEFFGSFRSYERGLRHYCIGSIIYNNQNPWASTATSTTKGEDRPRKV